MDVPFSCCSNDIPKPCIHHDILNPSAVYDYNPKQLTITTLGCRSKIISRGRIIRTFLAGYLALLSVYQVVLSFFARLLQTAHSNDLYIGPRKPRYHVWIVFRPDDLPYHEQRSEESHPRKQQFNQNAPSSSTSSSSTEEEIDVPVKHRRHKTSSLKVLNKIRSKISTVRAKSLPLLKSSRLFSKSRSKKRHVHPSEDEDEGETTRRLLPDQRINSEVFSREDHGSDSSSSEDSSMADLPPPPPPPPPFLVTLDVENEEGDAASVHSRHSTVETNIKDAFKDNIIATQNSGRRVKVLEKFAKIWERSNRVAQHRERGGADCSSSELSSRSNRSIRVQLNSTDVYNRFRGSLQHTLARRETVQARRVLRTASSMNMEARRSNLLARLRCNEVPPSYRLIANLEDQRRPGSQVHAVPPSAPPPPLSIPSTRGSAPASQRQRHCSICNRPVQHSRTSSSESLIDRGDARRFSVPRGTEGTRSRGDYLPCHRSTLVSKSVRRS
ncbi:uncharacterized protein LOC143179562 [Calliopsis andreniformis]|uniref:uncharacterized protein LOC143179562 n=1 Tax=Calliopsis andreniformis TaxID=337506 RepID=UPI003FCE4250